MNSNAAISEDTGGESGEVLLDVEERVSDLGMSFFVRAGRGLLALRPDGIDLFLTESVGDIVGFGGRTNVHAVGVIVLLLQGILGILEGVLEFGVVEAILHEVHVEAVSQLVDEDSLEPLGRLHLFNDVVHVLEDHGTHPGARQAGLRKGLLPVVGEVRSSSVGPRVGDDLVLDQTKDAEGLENLVGLRNSCLKAAQFLVGMAHKDLDVSSFDTFLHADGEAMNDRLIVF